MSEELNIKLKKIKDVLEAQNLDALLVQKVDNFAWLTNGAASYVNTADSTGAASLLITPTGRFLITNNIEATRLQAEEKLKDQGWKFVVADWYQSKDEIASLTKGLRLGTDTELSGVLTPLRVTLLPEEQKRFRGLSKSCAQAMDSAIRQVKPGMSEFEIAAMLSGETQQRGVQPIVLLIATDQRIVFD